MNNWNCNQCGGRVVLDVFEPWPDGTDYECECECPGFGAHYLVEGECQECGFSAPICFDCVLQEHLRVMVPSEEVEGEWWCGRCHARYTQDVIYQAWEQVPEVAWL